MANGNWQSSLESLYEDGFNSTDIKVIVSVGDENAEDELAKHDIVMIGDCRFQADDIVKLAATVEHITNSY